MTEEKVFKLEKRMNNDEIAEQLRKIADKFEKKQKINLSSGKTSVELETDREAIFEIEVERENNEESLEIEIEWQKGLDDSSLDIG